MKKAFLLGPVILKNLVIILLLVGDKGKIPAVAGSITTGIFDAQLVIKNSFSIFFNRRRAHREQETWWDTSAEPEVNYYPTTRHSTDSYEDECFNYYDNPRKKRQIGWHLESGGGSGGVGVSGGGGHSSSSRDVSPLDEEQSRRDPREIQLSWRRHQESFGRRRDRRRTDSWDEDDDFE